ncbi:MAG: hypothetical protein ACREF4_06670, partial [Gammaproteobacteria bacterium]
MFEGSNAGKGTGLAAGQGSSGDEDVAATVGLDDLGILEDEIVVAAGVGERGEEGSRRSQCTALRGGGAGTGARDLATIASDGHAALGLDVGMVASIPAQKDDALFVSNGLALATVSGGHGDNGDAIAGFAIEREGLERITADLGDADDTAIDDDAEASGESGLDVSDDLFRAEQRR